MEKSAVRISFFNFKESIHPLAACRLQHVKCSDNICLDEHERVGDGITDMGLSGEVYHLFDVVLLEDCLYGIHVTDVYLLKDVVGAIPDTDVDVFKTARVRK